MRQRLGQLQSYLADDRLQGHGHVPECARWMQVATGSCWSQTWSVSISPIHACMFCEHGSTPHSGCAPTRVPSYTHVVPVMTSPSLPAKEAAPSVPRWARSPSAGTATAPASAAARRRSTPARCTAASPAVQGSNSPAPEPERKRLSARTHRTACTASHAAAHFPAAAHHPKPALGMPAPTQATGISLSDGKTGCQRGRGNVWLKAEAPWGFQYTPPSAPAHPPAGSAACCSCPPRRPAAWAC